MQLIEWQKMLQKDHKTTTVNMRLSFDGSMISQKSSNNSTTCRCHNVKGD